MKGSRFGNEKNDQTSCDTATLRGPQRESDWCFQQWKTPWNMCIQLGAYFEGHYFINKENLVFLVSERQSKWRHADESPRYDIHTLANYKLSFSMKCCAFGRNIITAILGGCAVNTHDTLHWLHQNFPELTMLKDETVSGLWS